MTIAVYDDEALGVPELAQLERWLHVPRGHRIALINAPVDSALRLLAVSRRNPYDADVIIAFATRRKELARLKAAYRTASASRPTWIVHPDPDRPGTDLRWQWLIAALRQYGVNAVQQVPIGRLWSAVLLQPIHDAHPGEELVGHPGSS
ncbi:hypothetical protein KV112_06820 [Mycolicibacter sp. MYC123]|uniref:ERCC4 domain-containing protein n=1 Tax=[Mycobacterium] zoologicum TaxID=2872311 RepID=A0ABU5YKD5_9MYCO|nr:hypothetical protein [Mycolicibacter sp. MYC123]MEB3049454.1 hypothetical protein [Mycolicibacter sp. MYC123]